MCCAVSCPTLCDPLDCSPPGSSAHGDPPGKNTGVGCYALLQGIFPTQGLNPGLPHYRWILYQPSYQRSPLKIINSHPFLIVLAWEQPTRDGFLQDCVDIKMMLWGIESWLCVAPWTVVRQAPLSMGILQARILEWIAMPSSRGSSQPRDWTQVLCIAGEFSTVWATREAWLLSIFPKNLFRKLH